MLLEAAQECNHEPSLGHGWSAGSSSSAFLQPVGNQGSSPGAPGSCSGSALGGSGPQHSGSLLEEDEHTRTKLFHKSMATVELFVFLFAPLIHRIKVWTWWYKCFTKSFYNYSFFLCSFSVFVIQRMMLLWKLCNFWKIFCNSFILKVLISHYQTLQHTFSGLPYGYWSVCTNRYKGHVTILLGLHCVSQLNNKLLCLVSDHVITAEHFWKNPTWYLFLCFVHLTSCFLFWLDGD